MATKDKVDLLTKADGYGVLIGLGAFFALIIILTTRLSKKYLNQNSNSTEVFMVVNRNIGIGLTASAVYSSWTWATELLWVVTMVYLYGVQSSYYYFAGLALHQVLMAYLGIEAKKRIPTGHTCLEIVELRYGKTGHILYMFLCLVNNLISSCAMILGAAGAISVICDDLHIVASTLLIPFGVLLYTATGGLMSTFITDYIHTFILLIVLCYICTASLLSDHIGGISGLYNLVREQELSGQLSPIAGNYQGSLMTGKSKGALYFGLIHCIGDLGLTIMDSSFWQKSFSASVKATVPGYLIAAFFIAANVWPLGLILGIANVVLEKTPIFPTYPREMTSFEVNSGFGLMYTTKAILGKGAVGGLLLIIYLAVTSTVSAQLISVSSIISFDIYRKYFKPNANNKQMITVSHLGVVFFGLFSAGFSIMLHYAGVDMTWFGYFLSMLNTPGCFPMIFLITWKKQTKLAFIVAPILGITFGLTVWIVTAYKLYGEVTIASTGQQLPNLYGGLTSLFLPLIATLVISYIKPDNFDWQKLKESQLIPEDDVDSSDIDLEKNNDLQEDEQSSKSKVAVQTNEDVNSTDSTDEDAQTISFYSKVAKYALAFTVLLTWVVWPLPLYRDYIWSKVFYESNVVVSLIWVYGALLVIGVYPIYDGRHTLKKIIFGVLGKRTASEAVADE